MKRIWVALAIVSLCSAPCAAQVAFFGQVSHLDRRLREQGRVERQAGVIGGGGVEFGVPILRLSVSAAGGTLAAESEQTPDLEYGRIEGNLRVGVGWIGLVGGVRLIGYRSPAGFQRWVFPRVGAELAVPFSGIAGQVYASGTTLVAGTSNTVLVPDTGVHVRAGVTGGGSRLSFFAEYHLERLRFDAGRQEQWGEVSFGLRISP